MGLRSLRGSGTGDFDIDLGIVEQWEGWLLMGGGVWAFRPPVAFDKASWFNACSCSSSWLSEYRFCSGTAGVRLTF